MREPILNCPGNANAMAAVIVQNTLHVSVKTLINLSYKISLLGAADFYLYM